MHDEACVQRVEYDAEVVGEEVDGRGLAQARGGREDLKVLQRGPEPVQVQQNPGRGQDPDLQVPRPGEAAKLEQVEPYQGAHQDGEGPHMDQHLQRQEHEQGNEAADASPGALQQPVKQGDDRQRRVGHGRVRDHAHRPGETGPGVEVPQQGGQANGHHQGPAPEAEQPGGEQHAQRGQQDGEEAEQVVRRRLGHAQLHQAQAEEEVGLVVHIEEEPDGEAGQHVWVPCPEAAELGQDLPHGVGLLVVGLVVRAAKGGVAQQHRRRASQEGERQVQGQGCSEPDQEAAFGQRGEFHGERGGHYIRILGG